MMQTEDKEEERNFLVKNQSDCSVVTIVLLALRPAAGINIDPLIALPVGGYVVLSETMEKNIFRV